MTKTLSLFGAALVLGAAACGGDDATSISTTVTSTTVTSTTVTSTTVTSTTSTSTTATSTVAPATTEAPATTGVPMTTAASAADDPAVEAGVVWGVVFDSSVPFEDKAAHLEDADALRSTVEAYAATGDVMGGITLEPTDVTVDGDTATVTYDILFGGTAAYEEQTGTMTLVDGTWTVSRAEFCSFMASARTDCPA